MFRTGRALLAAGIFFLLTNSPVKAQATSVKAVLFYDPEVGACETLINETLPPLILQHNSGLLIFTVDVTNPEGGALYESALASLSIPAGLQGVPLLVVENVYLSGLTSIQAQFPGMIELKLAEGGTNWPDLPGLQDTLQNAGFTRIPMNSWEKFLNGQPANSLAILVLAFLFLSLVFSILITFRPAPKFMNAVPAWVFPVLLLIGLVVASYLTYTELTQSEVFCGSISRCTEVQDSRYSKILGLISIGEFGIFGYLLIGLSWIVHRTTHGNSKAIAAIAMFGFAVFGVSFSIYLTFLEPFVIGATCLWCLTSATIMGLILPLTTGPVGATIQPYTPAGSSPAPGG